MYEFAEVLIDLVSNAVDQPFHYRIPPQLQGELQPGMGVTVPLGPRRCQGFVLRLLRHTAISPLRDIISITDSEPLLNREQLALICWMAHRYYCRKIDALHAMVPVSLRSERRPQKPEVFAIAAAAVAADLSRAPAQRQALKILQEKGKLSSRELTLCGVSRATLRILEQKGLVQSVAASAGLKKVPTEQPSSQPHLLQEEQIACFARIRGALEHRKPQKILLHGITASGKTEIYMQSIALCLSRGQGALVLVPEISLTPQMIEHFQGRFPGQVAVLHSRLTQAEKKRQWQMISSGTATVVLGARSAVFAPLDNIGLIVIDEEQENSYKQEEAPRYHAREVAWWRARHHHAVLLLGSATPSLESYYQALQGEAVLLSMTARVTPTQLPPVTVIDMRKELRENHRHIFSRLLQEELIGVFERGEQALLFINRRGFAGFVLCRECGYVVRCPSCAVSMTLHIDQQVMRCHYCAYESAVPHTCPDCGGIKIRFFSAGTQRVEDEVKKLHPEASLIRMDSDTTTSRQAHSHFYRQFREGKAKILIGTQMIAKGFDFPGVTLVGVVAADTTLNLPDFRAAERTFQLLTQVAGRTARGPLGGKVIIQTYHPTHYSILAAANHDYIEFSAAELERRRQLDYPPYTDLLRFLFSGTDEDGVLKAAGWFAGRLQEHIGSAELLGPAPAAHYRIKDHYRVHIMLKGKTLVSLAPRLKKVIREYHAQKTSGPVRLAVDFNPLVVL